MSRITAVVPAAREAAWPRPGRLLSMAALAGLYYGSARFGYTLQFSGPVAAIVWLPAGVGIAFLTLGGLALWPGVLIGDLLANNYGTLPIGSALTQTVGNILEVVVAAMLIRRTLTRDNPLGSVTAVAKILGAIAVGTAISATVGVLSAVVGGVTSAADFETVWRTWWLGDAIGALVVVPFALAWWRPLPVVRWRSRTPEALAMLAAVVVLSEIALRSTRPLTYLLFPVLIWAGLRFGQRGATLAVATVAALTVWNTTHYLGPFVFHSITRSVLSTQLFIAVAAVSTLFLEAVVSEREDLAAELETSRLRIVEAGDRERRRLERNLHDGAQQRLVSLGARLNRAAEKMRGTPDDVSNLLGYAEQEVMLAADELRTLAGGIHPAVLTDFGLAHAIRSVAARATIPVGLSGLPVPRFEETVEATAYFVVAEAVANAEKHAQARAMRIALAMLPDALRLQIVDDGIGGAVERAGGGLQGLRDRIEAIGGTFRVDSEPGRGTAIAAVLPVSPARTI